MALTKRISNALTLSVDTAGGTTYTALANITKEISGPSAKREAIKMDLLTDLYDTKQGGSVDGGQYKFSIAYDPSDTNSSLITGSFGASYATLATALPHWKVTYASGVTETFFGIVTGFDKKGEKNTMVIGDITIDVSGDPIGG